MAKKPYWHHSALSISGYVLIIEKQTLKSRVSTGKIITQQRKGLFGKILKYVVVGGIETGL